MPDVSKNYLEVSEKVAAACRKSGRPVGSAELLVVSKRWPAEVVREVIETGHLLFGESRIQEAEEKIPQLPTGPEWHFIGHIQKNKVRKILALFPTLHGVDSLGLAQRIDNIAAELLIRPKIFLQVNIADEESKHGFSANELREQIGDIISLANIDVAGLMAIPPAVDNPEESRPGFQAVRSLQEELAAAAGTVFSELSMGMSGDYEVAIEEGSTIVRVGSSIFGPRQY